MTPDSVCHVVFWGIFWVFFSCLFLFSKMPKDLNEWFDIFTVHYPAENYIHYLLAKHKWILCLVAVFASETLASNSDRDVDLGHRYSSCWFMLQIFRSDRLISTFCIYGVPFEPEMTLFVCSFIHLCFPSFSLWLCLLSL